MDHCVFIYSKDCIRGTSQIVVLKVDECGPPDRLVAQLTVEIQPQTRQIVQIRGRFNREAEPHEMEALQRFARETRLTITSWA